MNLVLCYNVLVSFQFLVYVSLLSTSALVASLIYFSAVLTDYSGEPTSAAQYVGTWAVT